MSYRLIDFEMWQKPWFDGLSPRGKLLFIYLVTSPHNDKCGTQPLARGLMSYHCGLTPVELDETLVELSAKITIIDDRIFANKFLKHQCRTGNFKSGIPNALKLLSEIVRDKLISVCGLTPVELGLNPIPIPIEPDINQATTAPIVTSNKELVTSNESKGRGIKEKTSASDEPSEEFSEFWNAYPKKLERLSAWKCWKTRIKEGIAPQMLIQCATHYADYCEKAHTETQYIKHPATFLGPNKPFLDWQVMKDVPVKNGQVDSFEILKNMKFGGDKDA